MGYPTKVQLISRTKGADQCHSRNTAPSLRREWEGIWERDPLSSSLDLNLVWAQRITQLSPTIPGPDGQARLIPIGVQDASTPRRPRKDAHL